MATTANPSSAVVTTTPKPAVSSAVIPPANSTTPVTTTTSSSASSNSTTVKPSTSSTPKTTTSTVLTAPSGGSAGGGNADDNGNTNKTGMYIGIACGAVALVALVYFAFIVARRRFGKQRPGQEGENGHHQGFKPHSMNGSGTGSRHVQSRLGNGRDGVASALGELDSESTRVENQPEWWAKKSPLEYYRQVPSMDELRVVGGQGGAVGTGNPGGPSRSHSKDSSSSSSQRKLTDASMHQYNNGNSNSQQQKPIQQLHFGSGSTSGYRPSTQSPPPGDTISLSGGSGGGAGPSGAGVIIGGSMVGAGLNGFTDNNNYPEREDGQHNNPTSTQEFIQMYSTPRAMTNIPGNDSVDSFRVPRQGLRPMPSRQQFPAPPARTNSNASNTSNSPTDTQPPVSSKTAVNLDPANGFVPPPPPTLFSAMHHPGSRGSLGGPPSLNYNTNTSRSSTDTPTHTSVSDSDINNNNNNSNSNNNDNSSLNTPPMHPPQFYNFGGSAFGSQPSSPISKTFGTSYRPPSSQTNQGTTSAAAAAAYTSMYNNSQQHGMSAAAVIAAAASQRGIPPTPMPPTQPGTTALGPPPAYPRTTTTQFQGSPASSKFLSKVNNLQYPGNTTGASTHPYQPNLNQQYPRAGTPTQQQEHQQQQLQSASTDDLHTNDNSQQNQLKLVQLSPITAYSPMGSTFSSLAVPADSKLNHEMQSDIEEDDDDNYVRPPTSTPLPPPSTMSTTNNPPSLNRPRIPEPVNVVAAAASTSSTTMTKSRITMPSPGFYDSLGLDIKADEGFVGRKGGDKEEFEEEEDEVNHSVQQLGINNYNNRPIGPGAPGSTPLHHIVFATSSVIPPPPIPKSTRPSLELTSPVGSGKGHSKHGSSSSTLSSSGLRIQTNKNKNNVYGHQYPTPASPPALQQQQQQTASNNNNNNNNNNNYTPPPPPSSFVPPPPPSFATLMMNHENQVQQQDHYGQEGGYGRPSEEYYSGLGSGYSSPTSPTSPGGSLGIKRARATRIKRRTAEE